MAFDIISKDRILTEKDKIFTRQIIASDRLNNSYNKNY